MTEILGQDVEFRDWMFSAVVVGISHSGLADLSRLEGVGTDDEFGFLDSGGFVFEGAVFTSSGCVRVHASWADVCEEDCSAHFVVGLVMAGLS